MKKLSNIFLFFAIIWAFSCSSLKNNNHPLTNNSDKKRTFYSEKLGIELKKDFEETLIKEVIDWLGTPYKYGGDNKSGTDCSGFIQQVYKIVYGINTPRSANGLYEESIKIKKEKLKQGELVFFKINTPKIGHVGIFLQDDYFIHASSSKGVMVSSLSLNYWTKYFVSGGKLRE